MKEYEKYKPLPFWSWNDKLEPEELRRQIRWMNERGIGGYFMHARSGLVTEYLSEEWMECIEAGADEGAKLGMKAWVYDENGWPSGFVGGKLLENEANRDQYITYEIGDFDQSATVSYLLTEHTMQRVKEGDKDGDYLNLYIKIATSTADILNPDVVEQFIDLTHEAYQRRFGDDFSKKIEGFFTDEPQYHRWATPYTVMIQRYFTEEYGEDILDSLGLLFVEKEGYRSFRYRYWKGMQALMLRNYAERVYNWCEEHGVKLTGHYIEEVTMGYQNMCCAGVMPFYEFEHIPGIDWLGRATHDVGELSPRQVGSVAAQLGKKQVITETFGCCGWDVTPLELKRIAGFQYVNGVNMICHHLIPYSERGNRKYDYPAHYSEVNPWVNDGLKEFNDYFAKLGYLLGEGTAHVNVAMLHPIRSTYFDYKRELEASGFGIQKQDEKLYYACRELSGRNIEYHFLDETLLSKHGFVNGSKIGCGQCEYEYLVLPNILTMDRTTESLLREYVQNGGKVFIIGEKPTYLEAENHTYDYLQSNCTMEDIIKAQPYRVVDPHTKIYATYRTMGEKTYLYVINCSDTETYEQTFDFNADIHSFEKVDILSGEKKQIGLTICLKPGEDAILYLSGQQLDKVSKPKQVELSLAHSKIDVKDNVLVVDEVSYSTDGVTYSKPWPYEALLHKLVREKYQGTIYFKYEFKVEALPKRITLRTETDGRTSRTWLNGTLLTEQAKTVNSYTYLYPISDIIQSGCNEYIVETDWYQDVMVHYALYGENVTESIRNCLKYDSELQPIYLEGDFGVFSTETFEDSEVAGYVWGKQFYIGKQPEYVTDFVTEGFPFYAGEVTMQKCVEFDTTNIMLHIHGEYQMAEVYVNDRLSGRLLFDKEIDISRDAIVGENLIKVRFWFSNRNLLGPQHYIGAYGDIEKENFELAESWDEDTSPYYRQDYLLKKFT